jgi:hypothetical protein
MNSLNFPRRLETARAEANERNAARASRSSAEQIKVLDARLGVGIGAVRERARLAKPVAVSKPAKVEVEAVTTQTEVRPRDRKGASRKG